MRNTFSILFPYISTITTRPVKCKMSFSSSWKFTLTKLKIRAKRKAKQLINYGVIYFLLCLICCRKHLASVSFDTIKNGCLDAAENLCLRSVEKNNQRGIVLKWGMGKKRGKKAALERASQIQSLKKTHYIIPFVWFAQTENMCLTNLTARSLPPSRWLIFKICFSLCTDMFQNFACWYYKIVSGYSSSGHKNQ